MRKQLSVLMISFSWVVWLAAVFAFPSHTWTSFPESARHDTTVKISDGNSLQFSPSVDRLEVPSFKVDWRLSGKLNSEWIPAFYSSVNTFRPSSFFKKSRPLFDVKTTFIQFFYTW